MVGMEILTLFCKTAWKLTLLVLNSNYALFFYMFDRLAVKYSQMSVKNKNKIQNCHFFQAMSLAKTI
jgi:hypothetical protein